MLDLWIGTANGQCQRTWFGFAAPLRSGNRGFRRIRRLSFNFITFHEISGWTSSMLGDYNTVLIAFERGSNIPSTCIPSTTIACAGQHSFNTCLRCTSYTGCRPTHQIPAQCWASFILSQHIASTMLDNCLRRWPNTNLSPGLLYTLRKHVIFNQCCFNFDPQSSTLTRHWNSIPLVEAQKHLSNR